jgi:predicted enzyme related to lactoylglutathione lyase
VAQAGIAKLWKAVVNVTDLDEGERFWSAVSGLTPQGRHGGQFSVLMDDDDSSTDPWMLLQLVPVGQVSTNSGVHLDFRVDDVALAAHEIEAVGGTVLKSPAIYTADGTPMLEWAVIQDPFGNEFCIIRYPL